MASSKERKPLYDSKQKEEKVEEVKVLTKEQKEEKQIRINDFLKRNYEKELRNREYRLSKEKEEEEIQKVNEKFGINFKPKLSDKTMEIMGGKNK
eukprot:CAMPEP_0170552512 /NCGR_PEP_ID=MMETSP0211-20121228/10384_1 /TAXON_ID=311385 /ORGANISM="Pseudokeronopsis sp., Strain OXSARD2" /LENGTH=94 /DNA_ID=CAMNT_0010860259 /DNA_START=45 /DNA_END=329 /DNA_ORIENTATION=-